MRGVITRIAVILGCIALSVAATKVTHSFRNQNPELLTSPTPCPEPVLSANPIITKDSAPESLSPHDIRDYIDPEYLSPYHICNYIDGETQLDLTALWRLLPINASGSDRVDQAEHPFMPSCTDCQAETFEYDLDGQPGNEVLLKISDEVGRSTRYLIFSSTLQGQWKLLGHIDSENDKYRMSQHKIFMGGGRSWLTITSGGATGSGVATFHDGVFLVSPSGVHEVLGYVSEGHEGSGSREDSREFFAQLVSCELEGDLVTAEVSLVVQYFGEDYLNGGDGILLWEKKQKAFFISRLGQSKQMLDRRRSTLSERELEEVYNIDSLTAEGYFEYNAKELASIARGKDPSKREWLRKDLAESEDTPEKRRLLQLLAR